MLFYMIVQDAVPVKISASPIDESLFVRIGQNDREALGELYEATERTMHAFVLSILKDPDDTADLVRDTYLKIRASAHLYEQRGKPLAWMFTVAKNLSLSYLRKKSVQQTGTFDEFENDIKNYYISDETDRLVLAAALELLSEDERQAVLLHVLAGLRHREIAKNMALPLSTVLSRYNRAIKKLKTYLVEQGVIR